MFKRTSTSGGLILISVIWSQIQPDNLPDKLPDYPGSVIILSIISCVHDASSSSILFVVEIIPCIWFVNSLRHGVPWIIIWHTFQIKMPFWLQYMIIISKTFCPKSSEKKNRKMLPLPQSVPLVLILHLDACISNSLMHHIKPLFPSKVFWKVS